MSAGAGAGEPGCHAGTTGRAAAGHGPGQHTAVPPGPGQWPGTRPGGGAGPSPGGPKGSRGSAQPTVGDTAPEPGSAGTEPFDLSRTAWLPHQRSVSLGTISKGSNRPRVPTPSLSLPCWTTGIRSSQGLFRPGSPLRGPWPVLHDLGPEVDMAAARDALKDMIQQLREAQRQRVGHTLPGTAGPQHMASLASPSIPISRCSAISCPSFCLSTQSPRGPTPVCQPPLHTGSRAQGLGSVPSCPRLPPMCK